MNDGVKILLERMQTHPEEFVIEEGVVGKWDNIVRAYESVLDPEDTKAYKDARNALLQQQFTEKVLEELVNPVEESSIRRLGKIMKKQREAESLHTQLHIDAHNRALGQTPIAGVTQTV